MQYTQQQRLAPEAPDESALYSPIVISLSVSLSRYNVHNVDNSCWPITSRRQVAGSTPNLHTMDSRSACIQGVLKVKVKGHVIRALLYWHKNRFLRIIGICGIIHYSRQVCNLLFLAFRQVAARLRAKSTIYDCLVIVIGLTVITYNCNWLQCNWSSTHLMSSWTECEVMWSCNGGLLERYIPKDWILEWMT